MGWSSRRSAVRAPGRPALALAVVLALGACDLTPADAAPPDAAPPTGAPAAPRPAAAATTAAGPALALLGTLPVKGRAPRTGYERSAFGPAWADVDRNGCDTRNDVLRRDLGSVVVRAGTRGCVVESGTLADPYTGRTIAFLRSAADAVQIDHVVALSDAWQKGARQWTPARRQQFANDPLNLLAVDGAANRAKSDSDAASWLPPARGHRCAMVARQVAVKAEYGLWVTAPERDAIARVLTGCPAERVPSRVGPPASAPPVAAPPATQPAPPAAKPAPPAARFPTCRAAKAAGHGPYVRGVDPEYAAYDDRDGDGVVCE